MKGMRAIIPKLKWRTKLLVVSLLAVLALGTTMFLLFGKYRERLVHDFIAELSNPIASALVLQLRHNMEIHQPNHFQSVLTNLRYSEEIHSIRIYGRNGKISFSQSEEEIGTIIGVPTAEQAFDSNDNRMYFYHPSDTLHLFKVVVRIWNSAECHRCHGIEDELLGYMDVDLVGTGEREIEARLVLFDFVSFYSVMLVFCIAILLIHRRYVEKPLRALRKGVDRIKMGDMTARLPALSPGELGRLADDINAMSRDLEKAQQDLASLHQEQMDRAGQLATVGELAAGVAHEIKNPISGIRNSIEVILDENSDLHDKPILSEMLTQCNRIITTIENLMNFAKPREPRMEVVDIHDLLHQTIILYREQIQRNNIKLVEEYQARMSLVSGDLEQLKQVFAHLLLNAFQSIPEGNKGNKRRIKITTTALPDRPAILVSIEDTGSGIVKEDLGRIFRPFFTSKTQGTGLGLSLCESIVHQHSGKISVSSTPGEGSIFSVELILHRFDA
jgi:signal transduction histidine kinase